MLGFGSIASGSIADSVIVAGGPVTINISLSSVTSTGSIGALSVPVILSISGVSGTDTVGTIAKTISVGTTGVSDTAAVTSVTALSVSATVVTISGVSSTGTVVTVPVTIGVGITAVTDTGSVGTIDKSISVGVTAVSDTATVATVIPSAASLTNISISGVSDTGTTVSILPSQTSGVSLTPVSDTCSVGTGVVNQSIGLTLVGNTLTSSVNTTVPSASSSGSVTITGLSGTDTISNVLASQLVKASVTATNSTDTVNNITGLTSNNVALTGVGSTASIGSDIPNIIVGISGTGAAASVGTTTVLISQSINLFGVGTALTNARTNLVPNSSTQGAIIGILGSGGSMPTGWSSPTYAGIVGEVTVVTPDYFELRIYGINNSGIIVYPGLYVNGPFVASMFPGQTVTISGYFGLVAGATPAAAIGWQLDTRNYAASIITQTSISFISGTTKGYNYFTTSKTAIETNTVTTGSHVVAQTGVGETIDFTIRMGKVQIEYGSTATAYIPTYGTIASEPLTPTFKIGLVGANGNVFSKRTNFARNNTLVGAVVGTIGSGGALPNFWSCNPLIGITAQVLAIGTLPNGMPYLDFRISGTNNSAAVMYPDLYLENVGTPINIGTTFTGSFYLDTIAGSRSVGFSNTSNTVSIAGYSNTGGYITGSSSTAITNGTVGSVSFTATAPLNVLPVTAKIFLSLAISVGGTVDMTVRVGGVMLEYGSVATPYIPTAGTAASVTLPIGFNLSSLGVTDTAVVGLVSPVPLAAATLTSVIGTANLGTLAPSQSTRVSLTGTTGTGSAATLNTSGASTALVSITGNTATGTNNTLTTTQSVQAILTGVSTSGTIGSDTPSQSSVILISGITDSAAVNNVSTSQVVAIAVTGTSDIAAVGFVNPVSIPNVNVTLSGVSSINTVSSILPGLIGQTLITGINSNETVGAVGTGQSVGISLAGNTATLAVTGILSNPAYSVTLTGVSDTATIGSDKPTIGISLNGNTGTATASSLNTVQLVNTLISGTSSGFTVGSILPGLGINVSGTLASPIIGILSKSISVGLVGNLLTCAVGQATGRTLRNVNINGVYGITGVSGVNVSSNSIDFVNLYKTSAVTFITDVDQQVVINLSDNVSVVSSSTSFDNIYKSSTVTFITVVDEYLVITLDNTYNVVLQLTEDNFIQQAESTGVVSNV